MAESGSGRSNRTDAKVHDLFAAIERVRNAQAERDDVVVEMQQVARARLELLAQDLRPVFDAVPPGNDQFEFALSEGATPRLWIDMTSFVRVGRDRRVYEFVKDTRLGRVMLAETDNREEMGRRVTDYVAERILERERAIEGDWVAMKRPELSLGEKLPAGGKDEQGAKQLPDRMASRLAGRNAARRTPAEQFAGRRWPAWAVVVAFVAGVIIGVLWLAVWLQAR